MAKDDAQWWRPQTILAAPCANIDASDRSAEQERLPSWLALGVHVGAFGRDEVQFMRRHRFQIHSALGAAVPEARFYLSTPGVRGAASTDGGFGDEGSAATVGADEASYLELDFGVERDEPTFVEAPADPLAVEPEAPEFPEVPGYVVENVLGDGASARVYRARHVASQRMVALKLMHSFLVEDEVAHARFLREGEFLARLRHPNIVEVYEVGCLDDGRVFLAMELVTGPTLKRLLATEGPMPPGRVLGFVKQIVQALVTVHATGTVHRDLKLANVAVVGPKGGESLKLLDFGLVHQAAQEGTRLTKAGVLLGSPAFMPPEQIEAPSTADQRADLYALGIMAYALLTGRVPFHGERLDILRAQIGTEVPRLPDLGGVEQVVHRLLHKDPALRTPTASHLLRQIQQLLPRPARPPLTPPPRISRSADRVRPPRQSPPRRDFVLLSSALLFALALSAAVGGRLWLDEVEDVRTHGRPVDLGLVGGDAGELCEASVLEGGPEVAMSLPQTDGEALVHALARAKPEPDEAPVMVAVRGHSAPSSQAPPPLSRSHTAHRSEPLRTQPPSPPGATPAGRSEDSSSQLRLAASARLAGVLVTMRQLAERTDASIATDDLEIRYLELRRALATAQTDAAVGELTQLIGVLEADCVLRAALLAGFDELGPEGGE